MSNFEHQIESNGYLHGVNPLEGGNPFLSTPTLKWYVHFMEAFEKAEKEWNEKVKADSSLQYLDGTYIYSMILGMEGSPVAIIASVDDAVQVFEITQMERVEEKSATPWSDAAEAGALG